jgi:TPR repeat protein
MFGGAAVEDATVAKIDELCRAGKASACATLGVLVARGNKAAKALGKPALELWTSACTAGSPGACASVVFHAMQNKVDASVRDAAAQSLAKTCEAGKVGPDCSAAAFALFKGWGTKADKAAARAWLAKNCEGDIEAACDVPKK